MIAYVLFLTLFAPLALLIAFRFRLYDAQSPDTSLLHIAAALVDASLILYYIVRSSLHLLILLALEVSVVEKLD